MKEDLTFIKVLGAKIFTRAIEAKDFPRDGDGFNQKDLAFDCIISALFFEQEWNEFLERGAEDGE